MSERSIHRAGGLSGDVGRRWMLKPPLASYQRVGSTQKRRIYIGHRFARVIEPKPQQHAVRETSRKQHAVWEHNPTGGWSHAALVGDVLDDGRTKHLVERLR